MFPLSRFRLSEAGIVCRNLQHAVYVHVMADNAAVFQTMAREMADEIKRKNALGEKTVFICPRYSLP